MEIELSTKSTRSKQDALHEANRMKLSEDVQEFQLSQQSPSMTKQADVTTCKNRNTALTISNSLELLPKASCLIPCKKLRIVSSKGRDLGVFNLEVRSDHNSPSKERTLRILKITKSNILESVNKPVTISLSSVSRTVPRSSPGILKHETTEISEDKTTNVTFDDKRVSNGDLALPRVQSVAIPIQETGIRDGNSDISEETQIRNNGTNVDKNLVSNKRESKSCINNVNVSCQKYRKIEYKPVISTRDDKYLTEDAQFRSKIYKVATNNEISSVSRRESYKKIAESPFPLVKCKKLVVNRDSDYVGMHSTVHKEKYSASSENMGNKEFTPSNDMLNSVQKYSQIDKDLSKRDTDGKNTESHGISTRRNSISRIKNPEFVNLIRENEHISKTKVQKDIMTIVPNHENLLPCKNTISALGQNTVVSLESNKSMTDEMTKLYNEVTDTNRITCNNMRNILTDKIPRNDNSSLVDNEHVPSEFKECYADIMNINVRPNEQNVHHSKNEKNLSAQWDIIKTAVSSVKDDELRIQALKALADCGIGIERHIPVSEKLKAVHDTQVQTTIFGLLDPKSFVLINKDLDSIQRISQITFHDVPYTQNMLLENNLHPYNSSSKMSNSFDEIESFDIDNFISQSFEENSNTLKMKKVLSTINTRYKKILDQLQDDFESVKKYDHDGMLNIHDAIIRNNIYDVQRHLMVLKQCKESVDITTESGVTGLELAIKYDVRSQIVKLLLDAGAQPVISKPAHESALIIAGKKSSMLLPMLVKHVSNPKLLDQIDEEGFTILHYCCINGNLDGVNVLISSGANINLPDMKSGRTPVFHALENNHGKIAQMLLHAGAITTAANFAGQTPLLL